MSTFVEAERLARHAHVEAEPRPRPDLAALAAELRDALEGEVRFGDGDRALYATDGSNYRIAPLGVVVPRTKEDVVATVAACRRAGVPLLSRGGGTSLAGQTCNAAVLLDWTKYLHRVLALDPEARQARVEPGCVLDDLRAAAEKHHLTFGPDPATHDHCTLGGMIGNDSCGVHSVMAGRTADNVDALEVLTYEGLRLRVGATSAAELDAIVRAGGRRGEIYGALRALRDRYAAQIRARYPRIPRRVSGYNLDELLPEKGFHVARALVGTESTCVTVLEATVRLVHSPPKRALLVLGYPDVFSAGDHVPEVMAHGPVGCEGLDETLIEGMKTKGMHPQNARLLPEGRGWLMAEFGGQTRDEAEGRARELMEALRGKRDAPSMKLFDDPREEKLIWEIRESGLGATAKIPGKPEGWPGWEDSAVAPARLGEYLRGFRKLLDRYGYYAALYGHFGQGCVHCRIGFDLRTVKGAERYRAFVGEAAELVVSFGGSLSGEHGDGQSRAELLPVMYGDELVRAFAAFKAIWDPRGMMNPGKIVAPRRILDDLRPLAYADVRSPATHFRFPEDGGSFARAVDRCVGVGKCRREGSGTMCPSYMVTREEEHSTRGRARLLYEMVQGETLHDGWRSEAVRDALDLCLACKGCKSECPLNVDMATYKAEFLSHYYERRLRPRHAYAFGLINLWARLASWAPALANFLAHAPVFRTLARALAGVAPQRTIPRFAARTFTDWFRAHRAANPDGPPVLLFPDTFNNHFHPETAVAAVEVLEAAGYHVLVPPRPVCCGRPLYDYGMLDRAKRYLRAVLKAVKPALDAGASVVGLEPSCVAVFRDEMAGLLPDDPDAKRLGERVFHFSEFLQQRAGEAKLPKLARRALVHGHCHHKAVLKFGDEEAALGRLGLDARVLDAGCCGMAGAFGFEKAHYEVSMRAGERVLLPAVREAAKDTIVVADGFSCREQIAQGTDRRALHVAEVARLALRGGLEGEYPECAVAPLGPPPGRARRRLMALGVAAVAAGVVWRLRRR